MVPRSIAEQLRSGEQVEPRYFDIATFCYIDVVDFMTIAAQLEVKLTVNLMTEISR